MSFEGPEETRGVCVLIPDIFHIIWFLEGSAVSQSVLHHFFSLKARLQCILMYCEGTEETRGSHVRILELFHIIWFWGGGYAVSWSVLHRFLLLKACLQCIQM